MTIFGRSSSPRPPASTLCSLSSSSQRVSCLACSPGSELEPSSTSQKLRSSSSHPSFGQLSCSHLFARSCTGNKSLSPSKRPSALTFVTRRPLPNLFSMLVDYAETFYIYGFIVLQLCMCFCIPFSLLSLTLSLRRCRRGARVDLPLAHPSVRRPGDRRRA